MESLNKSFDKLRTNGKELIPFMVSLSNALLSEVEGHEWTQLAQSFLMYQDHCGHTTWFSEN